MAAPSSITRGIGLDLRDFTQFAKALRKAEPTLAKALRVRLVAAGALVAGEAQRISSEVSVTVPQSIAVKVSGLNVQVVAGGEDDPIAGLLELGNSGGSKSASATRANRFRHPVFGNEDVWVDQSMHPFLTPAVEDKADAAFALILEAIDEAIEVAVTG